MRRYTLKRHRLMYPGIFLNKTSFRLKINKIFFYSVFLCGPVPVRGPVVGDRWSIDTIDQSEIDIENENGNAFYSVSEKQIYFDNVYS